MNKKKLRPLELCCLYYFIMRASFLGMTSSNLLHLAAQDSWLSILLGTILGLIPLFLFLYIINKYPNDTIFSLTKKLFGSKIGRIINIILTIGVIMSVIVTFYTLIGFISSQYLNKTPSLAIAIMFFLAITYILTKGITVVARTHVILLYFGIILFFLACIGLLNEIKIENIKPILESGWMPVLKGGMSYVTFNVLPLFVLTTIPKNYVFDTKHYNRNILITYILSSTTLLITIFYIISVFGPYLALLYQYPEYHLLKLATLGGFVSRLEGIISLHWLFDLFAFIVMGLYFFLQFLKDDWKLPDKYSNTVIYIIPIFIIFIVEHIFKNNTIANLITLKISPWISFLFFFVLPMIIVIYSMFKKKNETRSS